MRRRLFILLLGILVGGCTGGDSVKLNKTLSQTIAPTPIQALPESSISRSALPLSYVIPKRSHTFQSFNNCGPATYSMALSYVGISQSQEVLGNRLRPYQIPNGDNDDKSVRIEEIVVDAREQFGMNPYYRPNGSVELLKTLVQANFPVVLRVWLNDTEDIGHYILVRGYDDSKGEIIFDDSYYGADRRVSYQTLNRRWEAFSYSLMVIASENQRQEVELLLGELESEQRAWVLLKERHEGYLESRYRTFNQAVAAYYLGDYRQSIELYESVAGALPRRMLWYQLEPIYAYEKLREKDKVFAITDAILRDQNRAFHELYVIRGRVLLRDGDIEGARKEVDLALRYNERDQEAVKLYNSIQKTKR